MSRNPSRPEISVVLPVYFNEENLETTMASLKRDVLDHDPDRRCELVFVDDGSGDRSMEILQRLQQAHPYTVRVLALTRNFGQAGAVQAGLEHARGDHVVVMSADGQDPPRLINEMMWAHEEEGYDIAICCRQERDESFYRSISSRFFYWLMRKLSFEQIPPGGFDYVSMSRRAVEVFLSCTEAHPFFQGKILWMGFTPKLIPYKRTRRTAGRSRWTFRMKLTYLIDGVLSYSYLPLRLISLSGFCVALLGFLYAALIVWARLTGHLPIEGWAPLMIVVLTLGGLQMVMIGVLGEYLWRTLAQARDRPQYVVKSVFDETEYRE